MRVSVLKDHSNAAAFVSSTKVRIFRSDRRNSDRHGGTVLGFNAHLAIQFGIDLAKPPRMIAALAGQAGGSAEATALPALIGRIYDHVTTSDAAQQLPSRQPADAGLPSGGG
jgi:hypothetical protein